MSYIALYRKWRPSVFDDVVEQEHVVRTLKNSVATSRIAHAYLFCGTRGTGKTTMAKIFARAINCLDPINGDPCNMCDICKGILTESILDVIEIDAASNNSVDNVRNIRDEVIYAPSHARYKVYIIDEVHMLSTGAFNALLKTLEEPPSHVVFILATTDPHKLPATILSRCQRYDFRKISINSIIDRINKIAGDCGVSVDSGAARLIARMSDGALRDAISILDQCMATGRSNLVYNDVLEIAGVANDTFIVELVEALCTRDISAVLGLVDKLAMEGKDIARFAADLVFYYRNILITKVSGNPQDIIEASEEDLLRMKSFSERIGRDENIRIIKELSSLEAELKWSNHPRVLLEVALINICENNYNTDKADLEGRMSLLESKIDNLRFKPVNSEGFDRSAGEASGTKEKKNTTTSDTIREKPVTIKDKPEENKKADNKNIYENEEKWAVILNHLRDSGRMALYTNLIGTKAVYLEQKLIGIIFEKGASFKKMLVSKAENMEIIEEALEKKLGRVIKVRCISEQDLSEVPVDEKKKDVNDRDEFIDKARNMAEKLNVPYNIIDD